MAGKYENPRLLLSFYAHRVIPAPVVCDEPTVEELKRILVGEMTRSPGTIAVTVVVTDRFRDFTFPDHLIDDTLPIEGLEHAPARILNPKAGFSEALKYIRVLATCAERGWRAAGHAGDVIQYIFTCDHDTNFDHVSFTLEIEVDTNVRNEIQDLLHVATMTA